MSTTHKIFTADDINEFADILKDWPNTAYGNDEYEVSASPFVNFYFTYPPQNYLRTTLDMIEVHEAFEALFGCPYRIATHPISERPHKYGSARIRDLRVLARSSRIDKSFVFNFSDQDKHSHSPTTAGYFWRGSTWDGATNNSYSSIQLYYRWSWWKENRSAWRDLVTATIEKLQPQQVYSGLALANPLAFGSRYETATWERALTPRFYGLDIDYQFGMMGELMDGVRPPTWGFLLSDEWRSRLGIDRDAVCKALDHPRISITDLHGGQWIELGEQPDLYPIEFGVPELPMLLNKLIKPIRHKDLGLVGLGQWSGDPNERFSNVDAKRWLSRFDDDSDWPTKDVRFHNPSPPP
ncbi:DUF3396 domain-containing protein [Stenotrophomonas sp. RS-48]|uniref:type VI immunity family protein n=1 Tax=Stenotrophomonas sp. RS-48 TaxID=3043300 RepID=UPI0024B5A50A|nr:type VI immunity family protein [Stenotrophomonas sp. RS-48]MDI9250701.1 DUF3396 domain-containing protein [Stenotrophomonas sp. RS-48]